MRNLCNLELSSCRNASEISFPEIQLKAKVTLGTAFSFNVLRRNLNFHLKHFSDFYRKKCRTDKNTFVHKCLLMIYRAFLPYEHKDQHYNGKQRYFVPGMPKKRDFLEVKLYR